ncbi:helix-turn-helix domain-containing protein [Dactylosporangium sp. NPDC049140]|uniref:GlxA family transcriptional regulator n=1 Tax=Dactylosporangium sp. NPDC049140 TaxID=3155647 RepID=UPI0033E62F49
MPIRSVAALVLPGVTPLALGIAGEVFEGLEVTFCTPRPGPVPTSLGAAVHIGHGLAALAAADLVLALPWSRFREPPSPAVLDAVREAHAAGAIVAAHCVGAFALARAGLLDGRPATTHWRFTALFRELFPRVAVRPEALYVDDGDIVTGAGAAAGIDMCLHLLRREHGAAAAATVARELVVAPHRDGGQAQFVPSPVPADPHDTALSDVLDWARRNLHLRLTLDDLAARATMSRRTFLRRFHAATGTTPNAWLLAQRLDLAEQLLETTTLPVEQVAHRVGYAGAAFLRAQFVRRRGIPPHRYRKAFGAA